MHSNPQMICDILCWVCETFRFCSVAPHKRHLDAHHLYFIISIVGILHHYGQPIWILAKMTGFNQRMSIIENFSLF